MMIETNTKNAIRAANEAMQVARDHYQAYLRDMSARHEAVKDAGGSICVVPFVVPSWLERAE